MDLVHSETDLAVGDSDISELAKVVEQLAFTNPYLAKVHEVLVETRNIWQNNPLKAASKVAAWLGSESCIVEDLERGEWWNLRQLLAPEAVPLPSSTPSFPKDGYPSGLFDVSDRPISIPINF
jgi:hypothetical protein